MKLKYVKFSDERRKEFCIKTLIEKDGEKLRVWKKPVFEEGLEHIEKIGTNKELLEQSYNCKICGVNIEDGKAEFEYVKGVTLEDKYTEALHAGNYEEYEKLLLFHKNMIIGKESNRTSFAENDGCSKVFGDCNLMIGKPALKCCNYDMIAGNIIFRDDEAVLIDYEWVFDFAVPVDYVLYHCIQNYYEHYPETEELYPLDRALEIIGVKTDRELLENAYRSFYNYVITDDRTEGYALMKQICLKNTEEMDTIKRKKLEYECECTRLQGVVDDINKQLIDKAIVLEDVRNELQKVALKRDEIERKYTHTVKGFVDMRLRERRD